MSPCCRIPDCRGWVRCRTLDTFFGGCSWRSLPWAEIRRKVILQPWRLTEPGVLPLECSSWTEASSLSPTRLWPLRSFILNTRWSEAVRISGRSLVEVWAREMDAANDVEQEKWPHKWWRKETEAIYKKNTNSPLSELIFYRINETMIL
jgi:hypothetical protein